MTQTNFKHAARHLIAAALALAAAPAVAQGDPRDLCPERPGLNTPPCIVDKGHVLVETSGADWTLERGAGSRTDTVLVGDTIVRIGLSDRAEAQIGWTPYGHVRVRDASGVTRRSGVGDATVALKLNLANPDGSGFSAAVKPYATLPTGGSAIGAGTWTAGLLAPLSYELGDAVQIELTPEIDAAANDSGDGRHLAWGSAAGVQVDLSKAVSMSVEAQLLRDDAPGDHHTRALGAVSLAWKVSDETQLDAGVIKGLNHDSPDVEVIAGVSRRF